MQIAKIRVDLSLDREFDYLVPAQWTGHLQVGSRVRVPFGRRKILGTVVGWASPAAAGREDLKPIAEIIGDRTIFTPELLRVARWMSEYYICPLEQALRCLVPAAVQKAQIKGKRKPVAKDGEAVEHVPKRFQLSADQQKALEFIRGELMGEAPTPILLHGATGSGKTEVYLQAIEEVLNAGKSAIMLVPEIALTPQTIERFQARFGNRPGGPTIAILHSHLSAGERFHEWQRLRKGEARIAIGARSVVFAPVKSLGLIVVDEEHENTYKQDEAPRYHARNVAVMRGKFEGALVLLGSATPSMESYYNVQAGKYRLCSLPKRIDEIQMPLVRIVDMREEALRQKGLRIFSETLKEAIQKRLERREQTILFLNRRGYATSMLCPACGHVPQCNQCAIPFTYHRALAKLMCHLCGTEKPAPNVCESCRSPEVKFTGLGTEKVEEGIQKLFPQARIVRMDSDTMTRKRAYVETLMDFRRGKIDILLGTQMIAKGLDFPNVTLVGIVYADMALHLPDFRAGERTFQLVTQVAGRAGRGDVMGEVIVQTFTPHHPAIQFARHHDFVGFYEEEISYREQLDYPPFSHLVIIELSAVQETEVDFVARWLQKEMSEKIPKHVTLLGPAVPPMAKLRGRHRRQILLRSRVMKTLAKVLHPLLGRVPRQKNVRVSVDVDALNLL